MSVRVSIITVCRNDLAGLRRTRASVQEQSWSDIEHIVVDGASTDGTRAWLEAQDDPPLWTSEADEGLYDAMNKGIARATGDLVWFMNSADTFADAAAVATAATRYLQRPYDWAYGLSSVVTEGVPTAVRGPVPFSLAEMLVGGQVVPHQASVFAASAVRRIGAYDTSFPVIADQLFIAEAAALSAPVFIPRVLCTFDGSGVGSRRTSRDHFADLHRMRRALRLTVTRTSVSDDIVAAAFWTLTVAQRLLRRRLARTVRAR